MSNANLVHYWKMNGLGNDFVIIDARSQAVALSPALAARIADRQGGIGCDQVVVLEKSARADVFMRIFNSDGSEVSACGNASRCVAVLLSGETGRSEHIIETTAGMLYATTRGKRAATIDMGTPRFRWQDIPLAQPAEDTRSVALDMTGIGNSTLGVPSVVNVGNPHCIFWVSDVRAHDLARIGPLLERHPMFPQRANISLAQVVPPDAIVLRVWERGTGLTKACGTAACAAAVAAARKELTGRRVNVVLPGGDLLIEWRESDDHILMTGPVEFEYEDDLNLAEWSEPAA